MTALWCMYDIKGRYVDEEDSKEALVLKRLNS